ncbi:translation initiation factor IF-2 [Thalassobaculum litoreum DSM 18839]|uniref:Translation initiation factor IF-2 n=3 Tax=Thalassobaculaceae TaxID=2844864 RepID=A0A8G2EYQ2_9PROT|nr:translation initiation factor IF-2 [Thalassobaculum litoreum DSM 18839]
MDDVGKDDMSSTNEQDRKKLSLGSGKGKLSLGKTVETGQVKQSFSHGRSKTVQVEVRRRRPSQPLPGSREAAIAAAKAGGGKGGRELTAEEREARARVLEQAAARRPEEQPEAVTEETVSPAAAAETPAEAQDAVASEPAAPVDRRQAELDEMRKIEDAEAAVKAAEAARLAEEEAARQAKAAAERATARLDREGTPAPAASPAARAPVENEDDDRRKRSGGGGGAKEAPAKRPARTRTTNEPRRRQGKLTISDALSGDSGRVRSLASVRRARERERQRSRNDQGDAVKQSRDVVVPETITVQELANRMAERGGEVIKSLMKMGVMATINQIIDADTAELVAQEFGHKVRRVAESDVELGMLGTDDKVEDLRPRCPVVTVMGHVDHGKTSLLDAIRQADVASGEAGGITQHIGAYQIEVPSGDKITFIDTPGHEAFTEMRARGANVTDIVILVVAADDGIMAQTVEAIRHARAAKVPVIVAVNKIDKPDADPQRVRTELLQHEIVVEDMGGDVQAIDVSALTKQGLDTLLEAIALQAEVLELKANPDRAATGVVIEAKVERGRGSVATVLVQRGTVRTGDVFVAGAEWGRVRALVNDRGEPSESAGPSEPIEVLGLQGTPTAGDDFVVVENESRAREIADYRQRLLREKSATAGARGTVEQMLSAIQSGEADELPLVIKTDVHGSLEAIRATLEKLETSVVKPRILHSAVGGISESDVSLAGASGGIIVGFNVRANPQAREMARRDGMEIRYYSIIYDLIDDVKALLTGMLAPELKEEFLGYAQIRQVFNITKVGKVAGCMVTDGVIKRGCKVRLLRDNVVIHEGSLKTLKRFKDEVREVREGYECGMAFENYDDIREGDQIECFELKEVARTLEQVQQEASAG